VAREEGLAESGWATLVEPPLEPELEPLFKEIPIWLFKIWPKTTTFKWHLQYCTSSREWLGNLVEPPLEPEVELLKEIPIWLFKIWSPKQQLFNFWVDHYMCKMRQHW